MLDSKLLDIIACPVCKGKLTHKTDTNELVCHFERLAYPINEGIPALLEVEARRMSADEE